MHVSLKSKSRRRRKRSPCSNPDPQSGRGPTNSGLSEKFTEVTRWLGQGGVHTSTDSSSTCGTQVMTTDMLKFLTNKLKSQSLNEAQAYHGEDVADDERDSGTESDDNLEEEYPYNSKSSLTESSQLNNNREPGSLNDNQSGVDSTGIKTHEISEHNFDTVSCTSDYERQSLDFDRHSSEDELITINKENVAEKRKWSQVQRHCDSAGSSDEEVKEYLLNPQPVLLSSSPPKGVQKIYSHLPSSRQVLARMAPLSVSTMSPRKRHRHNATSERRFESDLSSFTQRPCLDFEKMQKVQTFV